jgi:hypothetical protein
MEHAATLDLYQFEDPAFTINSNARAGKPQGA